MKKSVFLLKSPPASNYTTYKKTDGEHFKYTQQYLKIKSFEMGIYIARKFFLYHFRMCQVKNPISKLHLLTAKSNFH